MQWTVLNSGLSLLGYWAAAALVDKHWYGRRLMQVRARGAGCFLGGSTSPKLPRLVGFERRQHPSRTRHPQSQPRAPSPPHPPHPLNLHPHPHPHPQTLGFIMMFALFLMCGAGYGVLTASSAGFKVFQVGESGGGLGGGAQ
jgi:hypothetical protein